MPTILLLKKATIELRINLIILIFRALAVPESLSNSMCRLLYNRTPTFRSPTSLNRQHDLSVSLLMQTKIVWWTG